MAATVLYVGENPIDRLALGMNTRDDQQKGIVEQGIVELGKLGEHIKNIPYTVMEIIGAGLYVKPNLDNVETLRGKGENATRALLKDTHSTFGLLMRGLSIATEGLRRGEKISVGLYKEDIHHKDFIDGVKEATDNGKHAEGLTLEINQDPYGSLSENNDKSKAGIKKIQEIYHLGVGIAIEAFDEKPDGEIDIDNIRSIVINGHIKPRYIKISKSVADKIKNHKVAPYISNIYNGLLNLGIRIIEYIGGISKSKDTTEEANKQKTMAMTLIDSATIEYEPMFTFEGKIWVEELLIRFKGVRTDVGLAQLKELGYTKELMIKMLGVAIERAKQGKKISINNYIKDLGSDDLIAIVNKLTQHLPLKHRKNIIFEILEERFGIMNEKFFKHIRELQEVCSIAIDDLYVSSNDTGMSLEILNELLSEKIYPDFIKIDGKHSMAIRNGSISDIDLNHIRTLIGQFALQKPITIVAEWIQDMEHARKILSIFSGIKNITILFQGREINEGNFGSQNELATI